MCKCFSVIVAGGSGMRFGSQLPKQFVLLAGKPVLMHTLTRFSDYYYSHAGIEGEIILVLPSAHIATWQKLCDDYSFTVPHRVVAGGDTRFFSVLNALKTIHCNESDAVVAIHDGVRPLVTTEIIENAFKVAMESGSAIPVTPLTDSVRKVEPGGNSYALNRNELCAVQTPQAFKLNLLQDAYSVPYDESFTDDASVYERMGRQVTLIEGSHHNIKITNSMDIAIAGAILSHNL